MLRVAMPESLQVGKKKVRGGPHFDICHDESARVMVVTRNLQLEAVHEWSWLLETARTACASHTIVRLFTQLLVKHGVTELQMLYGTYRRVLQSDRTGLVWIVEHVSETIEADVRVGIPYQMV